jgi:hypothetical protein
MSSPRTPSPRPAFPDLPRLDELLAAASPRLGADGEFGLISVTVLQRSHLSQGTGWHAYDALVREIAIFLRAYRAERMRRDISRGFARVWRGASRSTSRDSSRAKSAMRSAGTSARRS